MKKIGKPLSLSRSTVRPLDASLSAVAGGLGNHTLFDCTYRYCSVGTCPTTPGPREQ